MQFGKGLRMTKHEAAIIQAYTGYAMLKSNDLSVFYEYCSKLLGHPVYTHEFLVHCDKIQELSKPDFIEICKHLED